MSLDTVDKILRMLRSEDIEVRCAAALVLGRLRPVEDRVVDALRKGIRKAPAHAKSYFLDAMLLCKDRRMLPEVVALLDEKGSIVDQAVKVVRGFKGPALDEIEKQHGSEKGWRNGAYIKAVAGIHQQRAARMLVERLPYTSWEEARGTTLFIAEHFHRYPKTAQAFIRKSVARMVTSPPDDLPGYGLVTCLRLAAKLKVEIAIGALLEHAESNESPSVRRHALDAMLVQKPTTEEVVAARGLLFDILARSYGDEAEATADVLNAFPTPRIPAADLRALADRDGPALKGWALRALVSRRDKQAAAIVGRYLGHKESAIRAVAITAARRLPDAATILLEVMESAEADYVRREMSHALCALMPEFDDAVLKRLRKELANGFVDSRIDHQLLTVLGTVDRESTNAYLTRRAKKLCKDGTPQKAIDLLQPLVRFRHADHDARFSLALANLQAAGNGTRRSDPRYQRAIDILAPLCRRHDFDMTARIGRNKSLDDAARVAILAGLSQKGGMEKSVCRALLKSFDIDGLTAPLAAEVERIRKSVERQGGS